MEGWNEGCECVRMKVMESESQERKNWIFAYCSRGAI